LFNYLFARAQNGKFILRLEDTDQSRCEEAYVKNLYDTFDWLGFHWDEGPEGGPYAPYVQSKRTELYRRYALELVESGAAYYCFCSAERLEAVRKEREEAHSSASGYDRACRNIDAKEAAERAKTESRVIRLKIPLNEKTSFNDALLGEICWQNEDINPDPVLLKSDGFPTYHLANIVDDHFMKITHVMRAQEWLASTPMHVILYRAFGWEPPVFCHLPMVMGQDGKKLSKRHGATSIDEFRAKGFLPEALINYVALLGASYEEGTELYTLEELSSRFKMEKLNAKPSAFDYKKLEWYNAKYVMLLEDGELARRARPFAAAAGVFGEAGKEPDADQFELFTRAMPLVKERAVCLGELGEKLRYIFSDPAMPAPEEFIPKKSCAREAARILEAALDITTALAELDEEAAQALVKEAAEKAGVKLGDFLMPLRVAITGSRVSPPLFGSIRLLGAEASCLRVRRALAELSGHGA
jgi:glutamyl-tRNA synthetase